ncbi:plant L-ascorbate oxidase [Striga asiatica]|uniref:Plant L-ascorbate oxidase n=1 Tax=Striga asiatica TaxID=4170 RepID=A0A5A7Q2H1_STRAF|nr:plant L-ascorbate oxidase [Striga asiatica]
MKRKAVFEELDCGFFFRGLCLKVVLSSSIQPVRQRGASIECEDSQFSVMNWLSSEFVQENALLGLYHGHHEPCLHLMSLTSSSNQGQCHHQYIKNQCMRDNQKCYP